MRRTALALAGVLTAACGGTPPVEPSYGPAPTALPSVPGIEAEVVRLRTDEAVGGLVHVRITDTGEAPFTVTGVGLDSPGFEAVPVTAVVAEFAPGRTIDLPTPYGEPLCSAPPAPAVAEVTVGRPDGAVERLRVPVEAEVLQVVHAEECAARAVLEVVDIEVSGLREDGDTVRGELTLARRRGEEPVTADRLGRSVLMHARADGLPLTLEGDGTVATPVTFTPVTCDPHVLSESKKPYVFPLSVTVGSGRGDDAVSLDLPLDESARDLLAALVLRVCAESG